MSDSHGCAPAREAEAIVLIDRLLEARRLEAQEAGDPTADMIRTPSTETDLFEREFVIALIVAQRLDDEADWAMERATGQRQLDDAAALMVEAADLFVGYAAHHRDRANRAAMPEQEAASLQKASVNLLMAVRLKEWLAGEDRYTVKLGRVERVAFVRDMPGLECGQRRYTSRGDAHPFGDEACRAEPFPIPAEIRENGDLVPVDNKTRDDCRQRFDNILNFTGAAPFIQSREVARRIAERDLLLMRGPAQLEGWQYQGTDAKGRGVWFRPGDAPSEFSLSTPDPRFDPLAPIRVNGYLFTPATEA